MFETLTNQVNSMVTGGVAALPGLVVGLVILIITGVIAKFASRIAHRITGKTELRPSLQNLIETLVRLGVWLTGTMIAAVVVFPNFSAGSLIAGLGIGSVAIGFAFQDIFENFLAGVLIMLRDNMHVGDTVECDGVLGKIEHITLRETHIRHFSGELTVMPNAMLFKQPVEIVTDAETRRYEVVIGVSYDTDLDTAASVIYGTVTKVDLVDKDQTIYVLANEFNSSSCDFLVRWWAASSGADVVLNRDAVIRSIKRELDKAGIEIPFPYVTHTFKERVPLGKDLREAA